MIKLAPTSTKQLAPSHNKTAHKITIPMTHHINQTDIRINFCCVNSQQSAKCLKDSNFNTTQTKCDLIIKARKTTRKNGFFSGTRTIPIEKNKLVLVMLVD